MSSLVQVVPQPQYGNTQATGKDTDGPNSRVIIVNASTPRWMKTAVATLLVLVLTMIIVVATKKSPVITITPTPTPVPTLAPTLAPIPSATPAPTIVPAVSTLLSVGARASALTGIAVNKRGYIYVSDSFEVFEIAPGSTTPTAYAGTYYAAYTNDIGTSARFSSIEGIGIDADGVVYVADAGDNKRIRSIAASREVKTVAGGGNYWMTSTTSALNAYVGAPYATAVTSSGNVYIADANSNSVLMLQKSTGQLIFFTAYVYMPQAVAVTGSGTVFISTQDTVYGLSTDGTTLTLLATNLKYPTGLALSPSEKVLYIVERDRHCISALVLATRAISTIGGSCGSVGAQDGSPLSARFDTPTDIAVDANGTIYVVDGGFYYARIRKLIP